MRPLPFDNLYHRAVAEAEAEGLGKPDALTRTPPAFCREQMGLGAWRPAKRKNVKLREWVTS